MSTSDYETAQDMFDALTAPFPSEFIHFRVGSTTADKAKGMALAYIDARDAEDRLDTICGMDGWYDRYRVDAGRTICSLSIRMPGGEWITKEGVAGDTDVEAEKGAESDALKRAGVKFGIGRYLYGLGQTWVAIEPAGKSFRIPKESLVALRDQHEEAVSKMGWGGPAEVAILKFVCHVIKNFVTQPSEVSSFLEINKGMIPQLRVKHRNIVMKQLDQIGATEREAA